jgi:hypothetical protein
LWATVAAAFGHTLTDEQLTGPLDALTRQHDRPAVASGGEAGPETKSLREMALMMRGH